MIIIPPPLVVPKPVGQFVNAYPSTANLATYSFPTVDIGTPSPDRLVLLSAAATVGSASSIADLRVNTVSVDTRRVLDRNSTAGGWALFAVPISAGTSIAVDVDVAATALRAILIVYILKGLSRSKSPVATGNTTSANPSVPFTGTVDIPPGGIYIGQNYRNAAGTFTATVLSEELDTTVESAASYFAGSYQNNTGGVVTIAPEVTSSSGANFGHWTVWR